MKKYINYTLAVTLGLSILSCSDDHFDINPDVAGRQTLWENINSNPELTQFAEILDKVCYSKSEGSTTSLKYSDMLNHNQTFTIWAPKNGTFDYNKYIQLVESNPYTVEKELIQNHLVRYSHVMNGSKVEQLDLFNSKTAVFDPVNATMGGSNIITPNIGCSNGVLHVLGSAISYMPNLYEFIGSQPQLDSLNSFLKSYEKYSFDEYNSTQGPTVNGNITWVDSVTHLSNEYFSMLEAEITHEDSTFAMVMPTNTAWENALKKTKDYFKYMPTYSQKITSVDDEGNSSESTVMRTFSTEELDSMSALYSNNAICQNLVFNANYQALPFNIDNPADCDSLESTAGRVFEKPQVEDIFADAKPIEVSNGYAYVVDTFAYRASDTWAADKNFEAEQPSNIENSTRCNLMNSTLSFVEGDSIVKFTITRGIQTAPTMNPDITFKLQNVMSCKYDIYVVMAYNSNANMPTKFKASITFHDGKRSTQTTSNLKSIAGDTIHTGPSNTFVNRECPYTDEEGNIQYTDSILIAKDFSFPVSYYGLDFYPTIKLASNISSKETSSYTREMWIDKIVLVAKE